MSGDFKDLQRRMEGAINAFKHDIASLRTGRASSNLLDAVQVEGLWLRTCRSTRSRR
jgi:ribosome recycling factor